MTIIYSKNYSFRKKWELFIQQIIQLQKNYSTKYSFKKFENYSFKIIIHFFEKLIIAQGYAYLIFDLESGAMLDSEPRKKHLQGTHTHTAQHTIPHTFTLILSQREHLCHVKF